MNIFRSDGQQRLTHRELRERIERQRSVATPKISRADSLEGLNLEMHNTRSSVERLDTQVSSLHHDVAALSMEVNISIVYIINTQSATNKQARINMAQDKLSHYFT